MKQEYFPNIAKRLSDPSISLKVYWSIFKSFLTGLNVPCILLIFNEHKCITDFREKAELWLKILVCFLLLALHFWHYLSNITFTKSDIARIIKGLDPNKGHGYDVISIAMLELCGGSIY